MIWVASSNSNFTTNILRTKVFLVQHQKQKAKKRIWSNNWRVKNLGREITCMTKIHIVGWISVQETTARYWPKNHFKKSIQKTILSDKDRQGIAESNNFVNKKRFVQLNKRDTKSLSIFEFFFLLVLMVVEINYFRENSDRYHHDNDESIPS